MVRSYMEFLVNFVYAPFGVVFVYVVLRFVKKLYHLIPVIAADSSDIVFHCSDFEAML